MAQEEEYFHTSIDGEVVRVMVVNGDTVVVADLEGFNVTAPRKFASAEEKRLYEKYRRYAQKVYPFAIQAVRIHKENQAAIQHLSRRKQKKYNKKLQKELEEKFEAPLKKLTKLQGKILVEMIERELGISCYELITLVRGRFTATYWNAFSRMYGYRLKEPYIQGKDKLLDAVLYDYDVSYELPIDFVEKMKKK